MDEDKAWVEQTLAGDRQAFAHLVEKYKIPVYNLAYRMLGEAAEAEEAAQETFLRAYTRLSTYRMEENLSSWLLAIASHYCIDRLRRRRFTWLPLEDLTPRLPSDEGPGVVVLNRERRDEVQEMLRQLPPQYRLVTVLRYWHDLSYREIAEVVGASESAVKSRLHRARQMLARRVPRETVAPVRR